VAKQWGRLGKGEEEKVDGIGGVTLMKKERISGIGLPLRCRLGSKDFKNSIVSKPTEKKNALGEEETLIKSPTLLGTLPEGAHMSRTRSPTPCRW